MAEKQQLVIQLGEIASRISSIKNIDDLSSTLRSIIDDVVEVEYYGAYAFHNESKTLKFFSSKGFTAEERLEAERTAMDRHPGWVYKNKKMLHVKDCETDSSGDSMDSKRGFKVRSRLWLPIMYRNECLGSYGFASVHPDNFNKNHIDILSFVCNLSGVVYNNIILADIQQKQNKSLMEANNNLTKINDSLDTFTYKITHDVRAPSTNIFGLVKLLGTMIRLDKGSSVEDVYNKLQQSVGILLSTIDNFVEVLKAESRNEDKFEKINIHNLLGSILLQLEDKIKDKGATINTDLLHLEHTVFGVKDNLYSVFFNLIENAIKYSSDERATVINIETKKEEDYIDITIKDNGIGIDNKYLNGQLYSMFTRFHSQRNVSGSGIGLYLVKKQIEKNKGKINVESQVGVGSTFSVKIPYKK